MNKPNIAICVFLYSLCVGCVIIPTEEHTPKDFNTRGEIDAKAFEFMRVGSTSKEEVLLKLGEPDAVWEDERNFLYLWVTIRGYFAFAIPAPGGPGGGGPIGVKWYELLIEFDEQGVIKQLGDIDTWAAKVQGQKDRPFLDLSTPVEIPVRYLHTSKPVEFPVSYNQIRAVERDASLILGKDFFEIRESSHNFRISPKKIILLRPGYEMVFSGVTGVFTYTLHFSEKTVAGEKIHIQVDIFSLTTLFEYLRQNCPNLVVQ